MQIVIINNKRILIKDNDEQLDISDEKIIQYTGILYKPKGENRISIGKKVLYQDPKLSI